MNLKTVRLLLLSAALAAVMAACSGGTAEPLPTYMPYPTHAAHPTPTSYPTYTPVPSPTNTPNPEPTAKTIPPPTVTVDIEIPEPTPAIDGRWRGIVVCDSDKERWGGGEYKLGNGKLSGKID